MFSFVRLFVSRPVFTWVISFALLVFGAFSFSSLSVDRFPNIDIPIVTVVTPYPGASPEQVETEITDPIEEALSSIAGINELGSTSYESLSVVRISFQLEKDGDVGAQGGEAPDRVAPDAVAGASGDQGDAALELARHGNSFDGGK